MRHFAISMQLVPKQFRFLVGAFDHPNRQRKCSHISIAVVEYKSSFVVEEFGCRIVHAMVVFFGRDLDGAALNLSQVGR